MRTDRLPALISQAGTVDNSARSRAEPYCVKLPVHYGALGGAGGSRRSYMTTDRTPSIIPSTTPTPPLHISQVLMAVAGATSIRSPKPMRPPSVMRMSPVIITMWGGSTVALGSLHSHFWKRLLYASGLSSWARAAAWAAAWASGSSSPIPSFPSQLR